MLERKACNSPPHESSLAAGNTADATIIAITITITTTIITTTTTKTISVTFLFPAITRETKIIIMTEN